MATSKKAKGTTSPESDGEACTLFFGGADKVRKLLTDAVHKERKRQQLSIEELDEKCCFEEDSLPSLRDVEANSSKMTNKIFCRVACILGLKADDVLKIKVTGSKLEKVLKMMEQNKGRLAAATGAKADRVPLDQIAPIYARFKILSEI